ncbi:methyltransferase-like protein 16 isoform X2 [Zootermopsis nevadensis]|uniref:methyltransferase-like protein 16 isoform X2 n=1 Tax=Zootermopsis nevadensis TaxID=136037 RepID=UPI000B8E3D3F|nr:methyltransferase-like protein 16 isoform X2 [Zootermopsis nevadensis]
MSQNKYMHPRNIYKNPPDFKQLAISYPEFRKFAKQGITGKVTIDFKNQEALRSLTTTLLQKDFGLHVEIPLNRLIPTLPLRLNYLLWIEDLMHFSVNLREGQIKGCGASCVYPLLASTANKWQMLATELDCESVNWARKNVARNGLEDFITVKQVDAGTILKGALDMDHTYDFTMCNPPFFRSETEADSSSKSRSNSRTLPRNGKTGSLSEVVVQGGELAFIRQMIQESVEMRNMVKIYSTMVGHKSSLNALKSELEKAGVASSAQTEFCQGHTTRWGFAWTFLSELNFEVLPKSKKKEKPPMKYVVPMLGNALCYTVNTVTGKLKMLFSQLQIEYKELKRSKHTSLFEVTAQRNTWTHQRRKRREQKKYETQLVSEEDNLCETAVSPKKEGCNISTETVSTLKESRFAIEGSPTSAVQPQLQTDMKSMKRKHDNSVCENNKKISKGEEQERLQERDDLLNCMDQAHESEFPYEGNLQSTSHSELYSYSVKSVSSRKSQNPEINDNRESSEGNKNDKRNAEITQDSVSKNEECDLSSPHCSQKRYQTETKTDSCILKSVVSVRKSGPEIHIEMALIEGTCGLDAVHQIMQYIKNNLKIE